MEKLQANERGDSLLVLLSMLAVLTVASLIAWRVHDTLPGLGQLSNADSQQTNGRVSSAEIYSLDGHVLPKLASSYRPLYQTTANGKAEADYLTSASSSAVHAEIVALCLGHQFRFIPSADNSTMVTCVGLNAEWRFSIAPASNLIQQTWYGSITQIDETTLGQSSWLDVTSGPFITD